MSKLVMVPMLTFKIPLTPVDPRVPPLINDLFDDLEIQNLGEIHTDEAELFLLGKRRFAVAGQSQAHIRGGRQLLICGYGHGGGRGCGRW